MRGFQTSDMQYSHIFLLTQPTRDSNPTSQPFFRPVSTQNCWSEACSVHWRVSLWTLCTATCGNYGFQSRRVECVHARTNKAVPEHLCSWGPRPANWQRCNITPCENSTSQSQRTFCRFPAGHRVHRAVSVSQFGLRALYRVSQGI